MTLQSNLKGQYWISMLFKGACLVKCLPNKVDDVLFVVMLGYVEDVDVEFVRIILLLARPRPFSPL